MPVLARQQRPFAVRIMSFPSCWRPALTQSLWLGVARRPPCVPKRPRALQVHHARDEPDDDRGRHLELEEGRGRDLCPGRRLGRDCELLGGGARRSFGAQR